MVYCPTWSYLSLSVYWGPWASAYSISVFNILQCGLGSGVHIVFISINVLVYCKTREIVTMSPYQSHTSSLLHGTGIWKLFYLHNYFLALHVFKFKKSGNYPSQFMIQPKRCELAFVIVGKTAGSLANISHRCKILSLPRTVPKTFSNALKLLLFLHSHHKRN